MPHDISPLSSENILRDIHDPDTQTIRTSATAVIAPGIVASLENFVIMSKGPMTEEEIATIQNYYDNLMDPNGQV